MICKKKILCYDVLQTAGHSHYAKNFLNGLTIEKSDKTAPIERFSQFVDIAFGLQILDLCDSTRTIIKSYKLKILKFLQNYYVPSKHMFYTISANVPHIQLLQSILQIICISNIRIEDIFKGDIDEMEKFTRNVIDFLKNIYNFEKGSFSDSYGQYCVETDIRNTYSASLILTLLATYVIKSNKNETSTAKFKTMFGKYYVNFLQTCISGVLNYIKKCKNYDGGFSLIAGSETHTGAIFCLISTLKLFENYLLPLILDCDLEYSQVLNVKNQIIQIKEYLSYLQQNTSLVNLLTSLQNGGFSGRPNKNSCNCYCIWSFGPLALLNNLEVVDLDILIMSIISSQNWIPLKYLYQTLLPGFELDFDDEIEDEYGDMNITERGYTKILKEIAKRYKEAELNKFNNYGSIYSYLQSLLYEKEYNQEYEKTKIYFQKVLRDFDNNRDQAIKAVIVLWLIGEQNIKQLHNHLKSEINSKKYLEMPNIEDIESNFVKMNTKENGCSVGIITGFRNEEKNSIDTMHTYSPLYALSLIKKAIRENTICKDSYKQIISQKYDSVFQQIKIVEPELMISKEAFMAWIKN